MKKIKQKLISYLKEIGESFKGTSKGAILTALGFETILLFMLLVLVLLGAIRLTTSEIMTQQALQLREEAISERSDLKSERDSYKILYKTTLEELEGLKQAK